MASFEIRFAHSAGPDELRERAERFARSAQERYKMVWHWEGEALKLRTPSDSAAVRAELVMGPVEATLAVTVPPPLLLMRAMFERDLRWTIERTFGVAVPAERA